MVAVGERDETLLLRVSPVAPVVEAHLDRHFHRGRAIVGVEATIQSRRRDGGQRLRQRDHRLMSEAGQDHLFEAVELPANGRVDALIRMAEKVHPPRTDGVEIVLAREVLEPDPVAAANRDERQFPLVVLHLGARVPDMRQVARNVGCVGGAHGGDCGMIREP